MDLFKLFRENGALLEGHFLLSSGLHSSGYLQCALVLQHPDLAEALGAQLARRVRNIVPAKPDFVISPAMGGVIIGHEVARALGATFLFAEREQARFSLRRGFQITPGARCVLVEDVITTGGSSQEVLDLVESRGAVPTAAGCIFDRSGGKASLAYRSSPLPLLSLAQLDLPTYPAGSCPMCRTGSVAVKPGSRPAG
ncbi:MAG: orotate phosphoribosyltransferase [Acidobacteria bacterium]|nr:orotate phosphoribosyltransferase [Acidobacteriota bacterium]